MSNSNTLFIAGNPHADSSSFIETIQPILQAQGIEWIALADETTNGHFDVPRLQARLTQTSTIILHFPLYWYSPPALVKHWLDSMLTSGWAFPRATSKLRGKTLMLSVTTGSPLSTFQSDGTNGSTLEELLLPLERTAAYCGMNWGGIVASQWNTASTDEATLSASAQQHAETLVTRLSEQV
ncbi:MAG: NAD(P)H-dependent oxidoreductase [Flavobacteriales bacterium]